ncbi:MAG: YdjY domain-containing protein [Phycisphaerales bacterium]
MVRLDKAARTVEFDAIVPMDCHDPITPIVYLELVCCTPDTREHESLLMTRARPSHIHAALLAAGFESGKPGLVDFRGSKVEGRPPEGAELRIELRTLGSAGEEQVETPADWITPVNGTGPLRALPEGPGVWGARGGWVFAGSRFVSRRDPESGAMVEVYDADGAGQVIGLTTFGSETIAWRQIMSPDTGISAPVWIARRERVPRFGTPVIVRLSPGP